MTDWTEKYRPTTLSEVRGNDKARDAFREWAETWDDHHEAVILHGSPGVGKTSAAHALAADMGWATVELNASDQRTADVIERFAGRAAKNVTLTGSIDGDRTDPARGRQLVILDEADNIHGTYDRGGAQAITRLVKEAGQPIVLIANEFYDMSRGLRNACESIEFRDVSARSIVPVLRDVCRREGIEFEPDALERIGERNSGDLRGAINDLQAIAEGRDRIAVDDVVTGERDRTLGIFPFLDAVLKEESAKEAIQSAYAADETPDDLVKWVEENVPKVYEGSELARAYDRLAAADRWLGRVRATQQYRYWRYATDNVAGIAAARDETKGGWTRYSRPQFWSSSDATADEVVRAVAESAGTSMATARRELLPYLAAMTHHCKPRELTVAMAAWYDLDEAGVAYVTGSGESTNKVQSIVADAREQREAAMEAHAEGAFRHRPEDEEEGGESTEAHGNETRGDDETFDDGEKTSSGTEASDGSVDETTEDDSRADNREKSTDDSQESTDNGEESTEDGQESDDGQSGLSDFL